MIEKTLRWIVIGGIFALPFVCLVVAQNLFFPYITGKNFTFRVIVEIITGAWLALALVDARYRPRRNWILAAFALFVLLIAIADLQGVNVFKSFWSNFERMEGWVTLAHLFAYLVVASSVLTSERLWRRFWMVSIGVSVLLSLYGLLQVAGTLALGQASGVGLEARIDATFGNPIYLAAYMLFHIFVAALLWNEGWSARGRGQRLGVSIWYGSVIALDTLALFLTGTRGTMIGLVGGVFVALVVYVFFDREARFARRALVGFVVFVVLAAGALWAARGSSFVQRVGFLNRLATISLSEGTTRARFLNMGIGWQGVKERPVLGWGQENYAIVFDKYYDPRMYGQEPWFDRVHNVFFDWLIAGGFLGLLSYLSIFGAAVYTLWKKGFSPAHRAILTGLLAGYFFHNLFVFDNITSYILFASLLAYIASLAGEVGGSTRVLAAGSVSKKLLPVIAVVAALLVWAVAWLINANALAQNRTLLFALQPHSEGIQKNLDLFKEAIGYGSAGTQEAREQLAQAASRIIASPNIEVGLRQAFFETAASEMVKQAQVSPLDARFPLFLGVLFASGGDFRDAAVSFQRAHELSPKKQAILYQIGQNKETLGDRAGALDAYRQAFELEASNNDARLAYAAAAIRNGQLALADDLLAPLIPIAAATDARVAAAYVGIKRYDKIVTLWEPYVRIHENDPQGYYTLAAGYYGSGQTGKAIATLEALAQKVPAEKDRVQDLIKQIRSGAAKL